MKRIFFLLLILLVTFSLGIASAFVWLNGRNLTNVENKAIALSGQKADVASESPILAYCELANNPEKYDGKIVRVSTKLWHFIHGTYFTDKNCYDEGKQTAVIFNEQRSDEIIDKLTKETKSEEYGYWGMPNVIVNGKFSRVKPTRESDAMIDNVELRFEILEVEKASEK
jgi:hypothetical protein